MKKKESTMTATTTLDDKKEEKDMKKNVPDGIPVEAGDRLMTVAEASRWLGCAASTLYLWSETGRIKSVRVGRLRKFRLEDLKDFADHNTEGSNLPGEVKE